MLPQYQEKPITIEKVATPSEDSIIITDNILVPEKKEYSTSESQTNENELKVETEAKTETPKTADNSIPENSQTTSNNTSITESDIERKALEVIRGNFGNGDERKEKLGDEYSVIQKKVNEMYKKGIK